MNEGIWKRFSRLGANALTLGRWRQELADDFSVFHRWIEMTGRPVRHVKRGRCGCNHRVLPDESGDGYVAVCTCGAGGEPVAMSNAKARAWQVNGRAVVQDIARVLPVEVCVKAVGRHLLWEIGYGWTRAGLRRRVLVSLAGKRTVLEAGLGDLFTHGVKDFLLLVADAEWCGSDLGLRLESVNGEVYALERFVEMGRNGLKRGPLTGRVLGDGPVVVGAADGAAAGRVEPRRYTLRRRGSKAFHGGRGKREMDLWAIRFEGGEFDLPDVVGSEYLVWLLLHPTMDGVVQAGQLIAGVTGVGVATGTVSGDQAKDEMFDSEGNLQMALRWQPDDVQAVLDADGIAKVHGMIKALGIAIQEAGDHPGQAKAVVDYREKKDVLVTYLTENTRPGHRGKRLPKNFASGSSSRQPDLIRKHLGRVVAHARKHDRVFFNHLSDKDVFRYGEQNYYRPPTGMNWQVVS